MPKEGEGREKPGKLFFQVTKPATKEMEREPSRAIGEEGNPSVLELTGGFAASSSCEN